MFEHFFDSKVFIILRFDFVRFHYHEFQYGSIALMADGNCFAQISFLAKLFLEAFVPHLSHNYPQGLKQHFLNDS